MRLPKIHVVEPPSVLTMHGIFNAAFLDTCVRAFPDREVAFHAIEGHIEEVRGVVRQNAPDIEDRIEWVAMPEPEIDRGKVRSSSMWRAIRAALKDDFVIFTSSSRMIVAMLRLLTIGRRRGAVVAALHGEIDVLQDPTPPFPRSVFSYQRQFRRKMPRTLRFVLLGQSIADHIPEPYRPALGNAVVIDLPYYFPAADGSSDPASFAVLGNCGEAKELGAFARALRARRPEASIRLVGAVTPEGAERIKDDVEFAEARIVERETYVARGHAVRYVAWLAPKDSYRLRASATFFDALAFAKPIFYTKNPYVDQYYTMEPAIGFRCEDETDLVEKAAQTLANDDEAAYRARYAAILAFRERFTPVALAPNLRRELGWKD